MAMGSAHPGWRAEDGQLIVVFQTILMKYHALFVIFEKAAKLSSAANYRWRFKG